MIQIIGVFGPLVTAKILDTKNIKPKILETVLVGNTQLLGEVVSIEGDELKIQVYEETGGLTVGEPITPMGELLSVELAPGMMGNIYDGIQRPLKAIEEVSPIFIRPGIRIPSIDREVKWDFIPTVQIGEEIFEGKKIGFVQETDLIKHWILTPKIASGNWKIKKIEAGNYNVVETVAVAQNEKGETLNLQMLTKWPVKIPRKYDTKLSPKKVFSTGQRVIDTMFPIMLGAKVSTPGPFGAGKTFTQQQVAKWSNAQVVVYVGCGERGNEMTEMVKLFPTLKDPKSGKPLMDRTCLIANTSNMPIAAREASIYTGITIAEYFRDMGYDVVLMADSTSRWAEALREISQRLGQMPSEEGYPAYISSRLGAFYERAGVVKTFGGDEGSVTVVGTVSPAGGDFSEPITQASLKNSQVFLALDAKLASKRHYPSINWITSYSLYEEIFEENISKLGDDAKKYLENRKIAKFTLAKETELEELVKIVGMDGLNNADRLILEVGKSLREDFLQQNGFDPIDTYCTFEKGMSMLSVIIGVYNTLLEIIEKQTFVDENLIAKFFDAHTKKALSDMKYLETVQDIIDLRLELTKKAQELV